MRAERRGYLEQDFRFFHLRDQNKEEYAYHYHEFHKMILLLSGKVTYIVEGKTYFLQPWDILLVDHHDIHRPVIDASEPYERIVLWIDPAYVERLSEKGDDLSVCFSLAGDRKLNLIRLDSHLQEKMRAMITSLENAVAQPEYGGKQLAEALFLQILVYLNRILLGEPMRQGEDTLKYDPRIESLLKYINEHLQEDLTIDYLAEKCYINRFYLMHRFKEETGYTIYNYIMQKRLLMARTQMEQGMGAAQAAQECGFGEYSAFLRAFKKNFGMTPTEYLATGKRSVSDIID